MSEVRTFETERLPLAAYLHVTQRLKFLRCTSEDGQKVTFVFQDDDGIGWQVECEFDSGSTAPATALFSSQRFLRRLIDETKNTQKLGASPREHTPR